jgi:glycerophosphoryl diester phosphodiesterase
VAVPSQLSWLVARPIAHRGYHNVGQGRIENTLPAVMAAVERGFAIEVDIQLTGDGEAVVFHDETLDRLTGETGPLMGRTAKELARVPFKGSADARIFTLNELFEAVAERVTLVVEIKSQWTRARSMPLVARAVEVARGYQGPLAFKSFDPDIVTELYRLAPGIARGIVADRTDDLHYYGHLSRMERFALRHLLHAPRSRPDFVSYCIDDLPMPGPTLLRKLGKPLMTWTVRRPEQRAKAATHADQMVFEGFDPEA